MDLITTYSLIDSLADDWKIDPSLFHDTFETLHGGMLAGDVEDKRFFNEMSFVLKSDGRMAKSIRVLNLLFPGLVGSDRLKEIKKRRLQAIIKAFNISAETGSLKFDTCDLYKLMAYVNQNPDWILQFGIELGEKGKLRTKIYFGPRDRGKYDVDFMVGLVKKIGKIFKAKYNKLAILPILENNIDAIAIDVTKNGYSLKIYDYHHFPGKKQLEHVVQKYKLINGIDKDFYLESYCEMIEKNEIYGRRNFDTMTTYRFENNSLDLKEAKMNIHLNPAMDAEKILKEIVSKSDRYIFDYFKKGKLKLSFIGNQPNEFFFYVR